MTSENRRESTIVRHNLVHDEYDKVLKELGAYAYLVPKSHVYNMICERTGLCTKTVAYILNHTNKENNLHFGVKIDFQFFVGSVCQFCYLAEQVVLLFSVSCE